MSPSEIRFKGNAEIDTNATLAGFWRWAFSDLYDDSIRGAFAEWMVRVLLGLPCDCGCRFSWAESDIILPNRKRIEVKSAALVQSYKLFDEFGNRKECAPETLDRHRVQFCRLHTRTSDAGPNKFKANFYVFCFQSEPDPEKWDLWDLSQWEFYVMSREQLQARNRRSISLAVLHDLGPMTAAQFQTYARKCFGIE